MVRVNEKKQIISYENSIKKSNEFSMSKLNQGLTLHQMQLFAYAIYCTQRNGQTEFHKADFEKKFNQEKYQTSHAKVDSDKIMGLRIAFEDLENDKFKFINVFTDMEYDNGKFTFGWNPKILPHIIEVKEKYITTDLTITSNFKSSFSWTLYEYLKAHYGYWHKSISKDALLRLFSVETKKTYINNSARFKKTVLDIAIAEINKHTEFEVWYKEEKEGRSIVGFDLHWSTGKKETAATKAQIKELKTIITNVLDHQRTYMKVDDDADRELADNYIGYIEKMEQHTIAPVEITQQYADELCNKARLYFEQLQSILNRNNVPKPKVAFYNWLDERE